MFLQDGNYYCPIPPCKVAPVVSMYITLTLWLKTKTVCFVYWLFVAALPINIGYQPYRQILSFCSSMSAPFGKPSPEGSRNSGNHQAMAIEDADNGQTGNDVPSHTTSQTPSERSRSDKREVRAPLPPGAVMPQSGASRFSHRGYDFHASREGMPAGSHHVQSNKLEVHHHEMTEVNNTMNLQQVQNNEVYVNAHDPATTQMVEQVAEARHREALANTESMMQSMVSEISGRFHAEEQAASARIQQMMLLAESRENQFREELAQQGEVYKRV